MFERVLWDLRTPTSKNICKRLLLIIVIYCIENWIKLFRNQIGLLFLLKHNLTLFYLLLFVFIRFITRCYSLSLIVIFCYSLSFVVIRSHLLNHSLSLVVARSPPVPTAILVLQWGWRQIVQQDMNSHSVSQLFF